jgi:hypothetical protein
MRDAAQSAEERRLIELALKQIMAQYVRAGSPQ